MTPKRNFIGRDLGHHPRRYLFISDFHKGYWQAVETELNSTMGWLKKNKKEEKKYIKYYGQLQVVPNPNTTSFHRLNQSTVSSHLGWFLTQLKTGLLPIQISITQAIFPSPILVYFVEWASQRQMLAFHTD